MESRPEGWTSAPLAEVFEVNPSKPPADALLPAAPVSFVSMAAVSERHGKIVSSQERAFADVRSSYTAFQEGDVLLAKITPCFENGKAAIAAGLRNGLGFGSSEFHVFRSTGAVLPDFLFHHLRWESFRERAAEHMTGTAGQARVPVQYLREYEFPVPPLPEQKRIVEKVASLLAQVRAARDRLDRVQQILKRFRQAVLEAACEGRLTNTEPDEFSEASLGGVVEVLDSKRIPVNSTERAKRLGRVPYYGATGQVGWIDDYLFDEELLLLGEDGAPFLDKSKPIAYLIRGKSWVNNHAHVLRAKADRTRNEYLKIVLDRTNFEQFVSGSTRLKLTQEAMRRIPVPLPDLVTQERIVTEVTNLLKLAGSVEARVRRGMVAGDRAPQ